MYKYIQFRCNIIYSNLQEVQRQKRQAPDAKAPPAGALPHPVEQVPVHVNEPKVPAGEQHASGIISQILICTLVMITII